MEQRLLYSGIGKRYRDCTFEQIEEKGVPQSLKRQYQLVKEYANNLTGNIDKGRGLLLRGPVGTMKTSMAVAVLMKHLQSGKRGRFITMASLLDTIFSLKALSVYDWAKFENDLRTIPILLIDDLGSEHTEGWVKTKVDAIISERYNNCLPVLITTNLSMSEMQESYAERIIDRLSATALDLVFNCDSLRPKMGRGRL